MKAIVKAAAVTLAALILVLVLLHIFLNSLVEAGIERLGPRMTGTDVTLEDVDLSIFSGAGRLRGLVVGNPEGFQTDHAFNLAKAKVKVDLWSILSDRVVIEEIVIESPQITFEQSLSGSNISQIQENVRAFASTPMEPEEKGASQDKNHDQPKIQINHFIMKDAKVRLSAKGLGGTSITIPLADIHLKDIGRKRAGASLQQVAVDVFSAVAEAIMKAVAGSGKALSGGIEKIEETVKGVGKTAEGAATEAVKGLKKLFSD